MTAMALLLALPLVAAVSARCEPLAREARFENTPATMPALSDIATIPGVEDEIRHRLELAAACERERIACSELVNAERSASIAQEQVISALKAELAETRRQLEETRAMLAIKPARVRWWKRPAVQVTLGAIGGAVASEAAR